MNFNKLIIAGNLTRDPELRYTPKGIAICKMSVAVNEKWKNEAGELKEKASFIEATAFEKTAENITKFFKKGGNIFLEGRIDQENWDDKQTGQKRSKLVMKVQNFQFCGNPAGKSEAAPASEAPAPTPAPRNADLAPSTTPPDDDGPPF